MSDWRPYLRERFGPLGLPREREEEDPRRRTRGNIWKHSVRGQGEKKPFLPDSRVVERNSRVA